MNYPKKSLGQHWLDDQTALEAVVDAAGVAKSDTVLEIGPGLGSLSRQLIKRAGKVIAVEIDPGLVVRLNKRISAPNFEVVEEDIAKFDLGDLPAGYKVVANIPYYISGKILRLLLSASNPPSRISLLMQKEVAQRLAAKPGQLSVLAITAQFYAEVSLGPTVKAELFKPSPKVDSQIVGLKLRTKPLFAIDEDKFFRLVKAGFSTKRKKLKTALAGGLHIDKSAAIVAIELAGLNPNLRAQELAPSDWKGLYDQLLKQGEIVW